MKNTLSLLQQIKATGLAIPTPEYKFWHGRRFAFDLAWPNFRLAVEIEGGLYGMGKPCPVCKRRRGGAHSSVKDMLKDLEKYNKANLEGWMLIRVQPKDVPTGRALNMVEFALLTVMLRRDKFYGELGVMEMTLGRQIKIAMVKRWKALKGILKKP